MHLVTFSKFYKLFIFLIFTISQVTIAIEDIANESTSLQNITDYNEYSSYVYRRAKRQNTDESCEIPNYPPHSTYKIISEPNVTYKSGAKVKQFSTLEISCDEGYKLPPHTANISTCVRSQWSNQLPACLRTCPSLISTKSTRVRCVYNNFLLMNCIRPVSGTTVRLSCNEFYEAHAIRRNPIRSCENGRWMPHFSECEPTCGLKSPKAILTIINGENVASGDYPWHIGIYTNTEEYRCGGSIINQNTILTAAHCVADYSGNAYPPENYLIAAGKYYRKFRDNRDLYPQYANVRKIFVPERYRSTQALNSYDIAVIILEDSFTLTTSVLPVCTELNEEFSDTNYLMGNTGIVPGWGYTQEGRALSDVLKELVIPDIPYNQCYSAVPDNFRMYITFDKLCGGYLNQETSICEGDSGGGLVYTINDRYFIKGVVSTSPATLRSGTAQCNSQQYSLYTSVYHHIAFVRTSISGYSWNQSIICAQNDCLIEETETKVRCRLPNFPHHGEYSLLDQNNKYEPGSYVDINTAILLSCDTGYEANITNFICLDEGIWSHPLGSCRPPQINIQTATTGCRLPNYPPHGTYSLPDQNSKYEPGTFVNTYIAILLNCDAGFETNTSTFLCSSKGIWSPPIGSCTPAQMNVQTSMAGCRLPNYSPHGNYSLPYQNIKFEPGTFVNMYSAVLLTCDTGFETNSSISFCASKGMWSPPIGSCTAPPINIQTRTTGCQLPNYPPHGTYSLLDKNNKYEPRTFVNTYNVILLNCDTEFKTKTPILYCEYNGIWSPSLGSCTPLQTIIENTTTAKSHRQSSNTTEEESLISPMFNNFYLELLQIFNTDHQNYLVSPANVKITLAMLLEGSKGNSAQEISNALGIPINVNSIRGTLNNLTKDLSPKSGNTVLNVGNMFAVPNKYAIRPEYEKISEENYNTQTASLDFSNSVQFASYINDWVQSKTKGFVTYIIDAEYVNDEDSLMIINALYFKAQWKIKFTEISTRFILTDATTEKYLLNVETLQVKSMFRYRFVEELNAQAVELPYSDGEFAMLILLPKEKNKVDELQINLQYSNFSAIIESLETTDILVNLPKFEIKYSINYKSILKALDINEIFSRNANLSGIVEPGGIKVNKILYTAKLVVNEEGDLPATPIDASVIDLMDSSSESVIANRPFLFFIYNMMTKNILFEGRLNLPHPTVR